MSTTQSQTLSKLELKPYIFFNGRCAEALEFYKRIFGGSCEIMHVKDVPADSQMQMPPGVDGDRIMHASFTSSGVSFYASDGMQTNAIDPEEGNVSLCINAPDVATGKRACEALSEGGAVKMPFGPAFWGGNFGNVVDRFGNDWMISSPGEGA